MIVLVRLKWKLQFRLQCGLTKVKVWAVMRLEECSTGFGVNVCSFTDQQLDIGNAPPLYGYMKSSLA